MRQISIRAARVNAGLSQKEAADALGISNKTLCSWEKGLSMPKVNQIVAICNLYKVAFDDLIFLPHGLTLS